MADINRYSVENADGEDLDSCAYSDYQLAYNSAVAQKARVIEHTFEWVDSEMIDDFTCKHENQHMNDRSQFVCDDCEEELGR